MQTLPAIILLLLINEGLLTASYNRKKFCQCEDLIYESECDQNSQCTFNFGICLSKPCNLLKKRDECYYNEKCGWYQNECQKFQSCTQFENSEDCNNFNSVCIFNKMTKQCKKYDQAYLNTCSEYSSEYCSSSKEGACQVLDGKCEKVDQCSDLTYSACSNFGYACIGNTYTKQCESIIGCEYAKWSNCRIAASNVYSNIFYICQRNYDGCEDWDLDAQNVETCLDYSNGHYHWTGSECVPCLQVVLLMTNIILLSIL